MQKYKPANSTAVLNQGPCSFVTHLLIEKVPRPVYLSLLLCNFSGYALFSNGPSTVPRTTGGDSVMRQRIHLAQKTEEK